MDKGEMLFNLVRLVQDEVITLDDLAEFSDDCSGKSRIYGSAALVNFGTVNFNRGNNSVRRSDMAFRKGECLEE